MTTAASEPARPDPVAAARALAPLIESSAPGAIAARSLSAEVVDALVEAGLFACLVPRELGGGECDISAAIEAFEEVSRADGSAGWCLMAGALSSASAAVLMGEAAAREIFEGAPRVIHAGQLAPRGPAHVEAGGYRVRGEWSFGSGALHATHLLSGCIAFADGSPRLLPNGLPEIRAVCVPRGDAELRDNWQVVGLEATGSIDYAIDDVHVPEEYSFSLLSDAPQRGGPANHLGLLTTTAAGHAAFAMGVGRRALDEIRALAVRKQRLGDARLAEKETFQLELARREGALRGARALVLDVFDGLQRAMERGEGLTLERRAEARLAASHVTEAALEAAEFAYRAGGSDALRSPSPIQRAWRDMHAGSQHLFIDDKSLTDVAKVLLGIAPPLLVL